MINCHIDAYREHTDEEIEEAREEWQKFMDWVRKDAKKTVNIDFGRIGKVEIRRHLGNEPDVVIVNGKKISRELTTKPDALDRFIDKMHKE